jgi:4-hydroxybenzoate polyprenyltransferase
MTKIKSYLSLIKFSHTIFAMPFALIGFVIAVTKGIIDDGQWNLNKTIGWSYTFKEDPFFWDRYGKILLAKVVLVILCMVFARSAAMAFNRYLDRTFDAKNPRTAIREIPGGVIKANNALLFTIVSSLLFVVCSFFINRICFFLSPVALFVVLGYCTNRRISCGNRTI